MNPLLFRFNFARGTIESFDCVQTLVEPSFKFILQPLLNVHNPQHIHQLFNKKLNFQLNDQYTNNKWSLLFHTIHNNIMESWVTQVIALISTHLCFTQMCLPLNSDTKWSIFVMGWMNHVMFIFSWIVVTSPWKPWNRSSLKVKTTST
jgi:hypothetical protein